MTDIFFSYSSADRERVRPIRDALVAQGFDVFWDQEVPTGLGQLDSPAPREVQMRDGVLVNGVNCFPQCPARGNDRRSARQADPGFAGAANSAAVSNGFLRSASCKPCGLERRFRP